MRSISTSRCSGQLHAKAMTTDKSETSDPQPREFAPVEKYLMAVVTSRNPWAIPRSSDDARSDSNILNQLAALLPGLPTERARSPRPIPT